MIKSTAIDPSVVDPDGVYRKTGPARVFTREHEAIAAIKGQGEKPDSPGRCAGLDRPRTFRGGDGGYLPDHGGTALPFVRQARGCAHRCAVLGRLDRCVHRPHQPGGACRRPIGKLRDGDSIRIVVDRVKLEGTLDLIGRGSARTLSQRKHCAVARSGEVAPPAAFERSSTCPYDTRPLGGAFRMPGRNWGGLCL